MNTPSFHQINPRPEGDEGLSEDEISARRRKRIWIVAMVVIILAGAIVAFNARSISRNIKGWQAERAANKSAEFLAAKDYKNAQAKVQDALALSPTNPVAMLAAARFLSTAGGHPDALGFWNKIEDQTQFSPSDHRLLATSLLATGDLQGAQTRLKLAWPSAQPGTPDDWMLALSLALQRRDQVEAIALAGKIMAAKNATGEQRLKAASLMTSAPDEKQRQAAWKLIREISEAKDLIALEALVTLAQRAARANPTEPDVMKPLDVADAVEANPKAEAKHLLFAMDLRLLVDPSRKAELIAKAESKFADSDDNLEALTAWLYGKEEYKKVLSHLPPEVASHRRSLFLQSLDAQAALSQWKEVADAIESAHFALDRVTAEMYLARCAKELGQKASSDGHWQAAIDAANGNAQKLALVGDYAEKAGNTAIAKAAFQAAVEARGDFLPAFQRLLTIAQAEQNTVELNTILRRMSVQWPDEAAVRNDLAYTNLLLYKDTAQSTRIAEELFAKESASLPHRITLSLARQRAGMTEEAVSLLQNLTGNFGPLEGRKRAVHAAALWSAGQKVEAKTVLSEVKLESLLPEEQTLVSDIN